MLLKTALERYEGEVYPTKRPSTARREKPASANLKAVLGSYMQMLRRYVHLRAEHLVRRLDQVGFH
jgi:hypothetical protein